MNKIRITAAQLLWGFALLMFVGACSNREGNAAAGTFSAGVHVLASRSVPADQALFKQFQTRNSTAISLEIIPDEIIIQRLEKGEKPDLVIFSDFIFAEMAKRKGLLQSFVDAKMQNDVPIKYSDASNQWIGLSKWALGVVYPAGQKGWSDLTYENMGQKSTIAWSKETNRHLATLAAALLTPAAGASAQALFEGALKAKDELVYDTDAKICQAVAEGKSPAALVNSGAYFRWRNSGDPNAFAASERLSLAFPVNAQGKTSYHLTVAAIPTGAANRNEALMLISFLITKEAQSYYSESAFELPVNLFAMPSDLLMQNGVFLEAPLDWAEVNQQLEKAQQLLK